MLLNKKFLLKDSIDKAYKISLKKDWQSVSNSLIQFYKVILKDNHVTI